MTDKVQRPNVISTTPALKIVVLAAAQRAALKKRPKARKAAEGGIEKVAVRKAVAKKPVAKKVKTTKKAASRKRTSS